uniref:Gfo/Idh/MocA family oxidoreductase n=1 Tax=Fundidesulfovibrio putealis TaxID=270496 RepID=A0A7C4AGP5_9BACT
MTLRAAVIGLGVGERHVDGYRAHPGCEVAALCDFSPEKLAEVGARHPGVRLTTDPDEILDDPSIDVVSIASWDNFHADQIVRAVRAGKHVFAEKPLCLTRPELDAVTLALRENPDVHLASNLILRLCPRFRELKRRVAAGDLGRVYYMEADYNYGRIHKIVDGWRGAIDYYSVFLGGAVHMVDLLLWLTGGTVTEVSAMGNNLSTAGTPFRHNDLTVALLRFADGAVAKVCANFACVASHFHRLTLYGDKATFENTPEKGLLTISRDHDAIPLVLDQPYPGAAKGELVAQYVARLLNGDRQVLLAHREGVLAAMRVCLAVEDSVRLGRPVAVE